MRKGAFQLSLSFIIVVVFAVIVLALAISWIQGIFPGITDLTHKVTDVATQRLLNDLASGSGRVGIAAPGVSVWQRGETGSYALGIRNADPEEALNAYVDVYLEEVGGGLTNVNTYKNQVDTWLTFTRPPNYEDVGAGESKSTLIIIKPPTTATPGIYLLRADVCENSNCQPDKYGSAQFALEIEG